MSLAVLVVLSAAVGAVALTGTVGAQESGENATANASDGSFYSPSEDDPLNVRFRDCCGSTVESVADGVLNLNVVYGLFDGPYDLDVSASGLSDDQVDDIVFDDGSSDATDLDRTDIVGMDFSGVPTGDYEFTVSVADGDAEATVPIEVTGDEAANATAANETNASTDESTTESDNETTTDESANESTSNETNATEAGESGSASIVANPATPGNESAFHNVSVVAGADSEGNLSEVTVDYGDSNASIGLVGGNIASATLDGEQVVNNSTTASIGVDDRNLTVGFDSTLDVEEGDRITMNYTGVTNPSESGSYTVGVAVNNGSFQNTTLDVSGAAGSANATTGGANVSTTNATGTTNTTNATGTTTNATGASESGNASIVANPSDAGNDTAFHNVSVVAGADSEGNLSEVTIDYGDSNASIGLVGGNIASATLDGEQVVNNSTTASIGVEDHNLTIGFDGTFDVEEGDRITMNYTGVTNPTEAGNYTVGVAVNNGSFQNTTLDITGSAAGAAGTSAAGTSAGTTGGDTAATTSAGGAATTGTSDTSAAGTSAGASTSGAGTSAATSGGSEQQGTDAGGPGFGVVVAVVALLGAALVAARRR